MRSMRVQLRDILLEVSPVVLSVIQKTEPSRNLIITIVEPLVYVYASQQIRDPDTYSTKSGGINTSTILCEETSNSLFLLVNH